jgi:hypothetical protein
MMQASARCSRIRGSGIGKGLVTIGLINDPAATATGQRRAVGLPMRQP